MQHRISAEEIQQHSTDVASLNSLLVSKGLGDPILSPSEFFPGFLEADDPIRFHYGKLKRFAVTQYLESWCCL